jgi:hypothetical protein
MRMLSFRWYTPTEKLIQVRRRSLPHKYSQPVHFHLARRAYDGFVRTFPIKAPSRQISLDLRFFNLDPVIKPAAST